MPVLDHFSLIAPWYDRIFARPSADTLMSHVTPAPHHRLLDVGGGTGRVAQHFVGQVAQVCVLDPAPGMVQEGQSKGICIIRGQAEDLPFASASLDRVIAVDSFHHLANQANALHEMLRVLTPGGRLVIEEPDIHHRAVKAIAVGEKLLMMRSRFRTADQMAAMVAQAGGRAHIEVERHTVWVIVQR